MRLLSSKTNVIAPAGDYPYGRIKDNPGDGTGTPVSEQVYGDMHQFFERLMAVGNVKANGQPENAYSGFQLFEAFMNCVLFRVHQWSPTDRRVLEIGDWNMDTTVNLSVAHGLGATAYKKIRAISVVIRDDTDSVYYTGPVIGSGGGTVQVGVTSITVGNIDLSRLTGGTFDTTGFDSTSFNRGWVIIDYARA